MWRVREKKFWVLIFLMRAIKKKKKRKKMLVRKLSFKDSDGGNISKKPSLQLCLLHLIELHCTAQFSKVVKSFPSKKGYPPSYSSAMKNRFPTIRSRTFEAELA